MEKRKYVWDIDVVVDTTYRVAFSEEVTAEEAKRLYLRGDYEDILDEFDPEVKALVSLH